MSTSAIPKICESRIATKTSAPSISSKTLSDISFTLESAFGNENARGWLAIPIGATSVIPMTVKSISGTTADIRMFNIANSASTAGATITCLVVKIV